MHSQTFLYIKSPSNSTTRVVELDGDVVRIGRSAFCEVRLTGPWVADVEGYLRRRGRAWSLQPASEHSRIFVQGTRLREQIHFPLGLAFEIGDLVFEIRAEELEGNPVDVGSFRAPILLDPPASVTIEPAQPETVLLSRPAASEKSEPKRIEVASDGPDKVCDPAVLADALEPVIQEPLCQPAATAETQASQADSPQYRPRQRSYPAQASDWKSTLDRCEKWLKETRVDRPQARSWQPAEAAVPRIPTHAVPEPRIKEYVGGRQWTAAQASAPGLQTESLAVPSDLSASHPTPPHTPISEPGFNPPEIPVPSDASDPVPSRGRGPANPPEESWFDTEELAGRAAWDASEIAPAAPIENDEPTSVHHPLKAVVPGDTPDPVGIALGSANEAQECLSKSFDSLDLDRLALNRIENSEPTHQQHAEPEEGGQAPAGRVQEAKAIAEPISRESVPEDSASEAVIEVESGVRQTESSRQASDDEPLSETPFVADELFTPGTQASEPETGEALPTVAMILAARRAAAGAMSHAVDGNKRKSESVELSESIAPAEFVITDRWPAVPLAFFLVLVSGLMIGLCWLWTQDNQAANLVHAQLMHTPAEGEPPVTIDPMPHASWWATTAEHLFERGVLLRSRETNDDRALGHDLIDLAENASPLHPGVSMFRLTESVPGHSGAPITRVYTRDIVSLAESARIAFSKQDRETGIARLIEASEMALGTNLGELPAPGPSTAERNPRWLLPQEDLFIPICRVAFEQKAMPAEDLVARLPEYGPLRLAAARLASQGARGSAKSWFEKVLQLGPEVPDGGSDLLHQAARAEALAQLGRTAESQELYEKLIEQGCPPRLEAACWANVAANHAQGADVNRMNVARRNARRLGIDVATVLGSAPVSERSVRPR